MVWYHTNQSPILVNLYAIFSGKPEHLMLRPHIPPAHDESTLSQWSMSPFLQPILAPIWTPAGKFITGSFIQR